MRLFGRAKAETKPATYAAQPPSSVDANAVTPAQVAEVYHNKEQGNIYIHPTVWTRDNEYEWCETVYIGKIFRNIVTLAKNRMTSRLTSNDPETQKLCDTMSAKVHLQAKLVQSSISWDKYGHTYLYPVYEDAAKTTLTKIKILPPQTMYIYRDTKDDIEAINAKLKEAKLPTIPAKAGTGDEIIGYLQIIKTQTWYFGPEEIIFVPRYPDGNRPNGYSLLVQAADIISSKLQIEIDQTIMAARHGDPKHVFEIPADWFDEGNEDKITQFRADTKKGIKAGMDFYMAKSDDPSRSTGVKLLEATGNPQAVIKTQDHSENQFVAAFGFADSFTESESSNRSVGQIQLSFFERDIMADRVFWAEIIEGEIIDPWLVANGKAPGSAWLEFSDLTPDDRIQKLQIMAPLFPYLSDEIVNQVLEQAGYTVNSEALTPAPGANNLKRFGGDAQFRRLRGIPRGEAALIRSGRDAITNNLDRYRKAVAEVMRDETS